MKHLSYRGTRLNTVEVLADTIGISVETLREIASKAYSYYRLGEKVVKPNGDIRQTYAVEETLAEIHGKIKTEIFYKVKFPAYLQGSIKDIDLHRDHITDAGIHAVDARIVIKEDIRNFFPSIKSTHVNKVWSRIFGCSNEVAHLLTLLTTYKGSVPQGASTSSYIGNLIFWDKEPQLVLSLQKLGFRYTRYVDDITVSATKPMSKSQIGFVTKAIYSTLFSKELRPNRRKRRVQTKAASVVIHGLNINAFRPTMPQHKRSEIRAAVHQCELEAKLDRLSPDYAELYYQTLGRVNYLRRLHSHEGNRYFERLKAIRPLSSQSTES